MTSLLTYNFVAKSPEHPDEILARDNGAASESSVDEHAADQYVAWVRNRLAPAFHVFQAQLDCLTNIGERFFDGFSLRIAALKRRTNHNVPAVVFVPLQKNLEI